MVFKNTITVTMTALNYSKLQLHVELLKCCRWQLPSPVAWFKLWLHQR